MAGSNAHTAGLPGLELVEPRQGGRAPGRRRTGRHERALDRAVRAGGLEGKHVADAMVSLARSLAWALDTAEAKGDPYAVAQVAPRYLEALEALGLDPDPTDDDDAFGGLGGPS